MKKKILLGYVSLVLVDLVVIYVLMPKRFTKDLDLVSLFTLYGVVFVVVLGLHLLLDRVKEKRRARLNNSLEEPQ